MSSTVIPDSPHSSATAVASGTAALSGKHLTFFLGTEEYGLEILTVKEIIGMMPVTPVPRTPHFIRGVINLRGKVLPVVDLRAKFSMEPTEQTDQTCIIVVRPAGMEMGIIVDRVSEVVDIAADEVQDTPTFGDGIKTDFIPGIGKVGDRVMLLLDIAKVLSTEDMIDIREVCETNA